MKGKHKAPAASFRLDQCFPKKRAHRLALTLLAAAVLAVLQLLAVGIAAVVVTVLARVGVLGHGEIDRVVVFMALISLVLGILITVFSSLVFLRPVNRLVSQMNRLARGVYRARITFGKPLRDHPTFREIADSFNKMAQELENTEMLRSDFINNFSHEFKTPIVSITGFAKLLKRGDLSQEQRQEYLDIIEMESLRLSAMATNVLDMTKVENQTILTDVTRFNLSEQIRGSLLLLLEGKWRGKEVDFTLEFGEHMIMANQVLLKHVWVNLLDNAIKFTPQGGSVAVEIQEQGEALAVTVRNTGSRIAPEQMEKIFHKFYQADESHATEGNGIGLALVKKIVQLHGGTVEVESSEEGTAFTAILPRKQLTADS